MEIAMLDIMRTGTKIYKVYKDDKFLFRSSIPTMAELLFLEENERNEIRDGNTVKGIRAEFIGEYISRFEINGLKGTIKELNQHFKVSEQSLFGRIKRNGRKIAGMIDGSIVKEKFGIPMEKEETYDKIFAKKPKLVMITKKIKNPYRNENKTYMDSLFKSAFKSW